MQAVPVHTDCRGECLGAGESHLLRDVYCAGRQLGERGENASVERCYAIAAGVHDAVDEQAGERGALVWREYHHVLASLASSAIGEGDLRQPFVAAFSFDLFLKTCPEALRGRWGNAGFARERSDGALRRRARRGIGHCHYTVYCCCGLRVGMDCCRIDSFVEVRSWLHIGDHGFWVATCDGFRIEDRLSLDLTFQVHEMVGPKFASLGFLTVGKLIFRHN